MLRDDSNKNWGESLLHSAHAAGTFLGTSSQMQFDHGSDLSVILRELTNIEPRFGERSLQYSRQVLKCLFLNDHIDLCSITPVHPFYKEILELIGFNSAFFAGFYHGSEKDADDLWKAMFIQAQKSQHCPDDQMNCILLTLISHYTVKLLPVEAEPPNTTTRVPVGKTQRVHTPLDLFLSSSPVVNRARLDMSGLERLSVSSPHPRHVTMFCNLMHQLCNTDEFPSGVRLTLLRYLVKQFHVFCLMDTLDKELNNIKKAVLTNPPFAGILYEFLVTFIDQSPSLQSLQGLTEIWLAFCRPWRYSDHTFEESSPRSVALTNWFPFIRQNERFYRFVLAKILRKFTEMELSAASMKVVKDVIGCAYKEPMPVILSLLDMDARPHVKKVLNEVAELYQRSKRELSTRENLSFWDSLTGAGDSPRIYAATDFVRVAEPILEEADQYLRTSYIRDSQAKLKPVSQALSTSSAPQLTETPKRGLLPDHETDPVTGLLYLTPNGRRQVLSGERRFDFSKCQSILPRWIFGATGTEFPPFVLFTKWLTPIMSKVTAIQNLASHYGDNTVMGSLARLVLDPPVPNPYNQVKSPVFCKTLKKTPPSLKLRVLADYRFLGFLVVLWLFVYLGWWALFPLGIVGLIAFMIYLGSMESEF